LLKALKSVANLIGWDVSIKDKGIPVVIGVNLYSALIETHQVFNESVFGERFDRSL
jgi:hypothetical protein